MHIEQSQIDKRKVQQRFAKAKNSYADQAIAQQQICQQLALLIQQYCPEQLESVLEIGCGSGNLTRYIRQQQQIQRYILNDIYPDVMEFFPNHENEQHYEFCLGDAEKIAFPPDLTAVFSSSALQWMQDLSAVFHKIHRVLQSQGWLCFSIFGPENLKEIKALTGQGLDYLSATQLQNLLQQQGFDVLHCQSQIIPLTFSHPLQVLKHLKATGVTANPQDFVWTKQRLQQFYLDYAQFSHKDGQENPQYTLTYHPIYVIARKGF
ncbi:MAG: malonyl-ACP O-methyltransferase BioC [Acinetobacter sp.]